MGDDDEDSGEYMGEDDEYVEDNWPYRHWI